MRRVIALALTLSALAACTTPMVRSPENGGSAVYILESIDDRPLPYLEGSGSSIARYEISEGLLQLRADGTFFMSRNHFMSTGTGSRRAERIHEGMWTRMGDVIDFEFDDGRVERGEIHDRSLILELDGATYRWVL